ADGAEVEVPVEAAWGPGAYVAVTVFRPGEVRQGHPGRALGLAWVGLDPAARQLAVTIESPERIRPRQRVELPVRVAGAQGPVRLTLAAVDEGVLRLTNFASPDPVPHYTGRRRLGLDIRDDYGRLIAPAEGELAALRQGGDEGGIPPGFQPPQRVVSLFSGVVETDANGAATIAFDIPDFAGELRLMAVAWEANRLGAASRPMTVRDEVVAEALLPRFLAPGDEARLPVLLHNIELPAGEIVAELRAEGPLELAGPARLAATLATGARAQPITALRATGSGEGVIRLAVTGPNNFRVEREARITIRSSRGTLTEIASAEIAPGGERALSPPVARFVPGTWRATASFGAAVRYDPAALLRAVEFFPLWCTEQVGSRALALSAAMDETGGDDRAERLQRSVDAILDRQRYDGAFSLWSAQGEAHPWITPFAVEVLLRARTAGATVPEGALREALRYLEEAIEDANEDTPEGRAVQAYRLHALAMAGRPRLGAARRLFERLADLPTQLSRAQLAATFARGGDRGRAEQAFTAALGASGRRYWHLDYGTAARDALATALLLRESGLLPERLTQLMGTLPGPEFRPATTSTQEQGWAVAAAVTLGQNLRALRVGLDGRTIEARGVALAALHGDAVARNLGDAPVYSSVSITGVPVQPLPAERNGLRIRRLFFTPEGQPLNLDALRQGQSFILLIEAQSETGETHQAMIQQGLPAGWEIADRMGPGDVPNMQWLGTLTETEAQPALDDRYAAAVELSPGRNFARLAVRLRAVRAGRFELPGGEVADMYRPAIHARQTTVRVGVLPRD
ncbi:MAG TPA: alpha-2-macroglobulin family protein, partial [Acetobacteraceae bacterium]|nr:alpha-2-macroglobulin family protein [Acetobacteraceae bacterium]